MSHAATNWAIKQRGLRPAAKIVLWHLCDRYNPDFGCFPKQETLAHDCELSRSSLNDQLAALERAGFIRREAAKDDARRQRPTRYRFPFEDGWPAFDGPREGGEDGAGPSPEIGHGGAARPSPEIGHGTESENGAEPSPNSGESRVRNSDSNPVREPVTEPIEREGAGARSEDRDDKARASDGRTVKAFRSIWPTAGVDMRSKVDAAWQALTPDERTLALDHVETFVTNWKRVGRGKCPAGWTYLSEKPWEIAAELAEAEPPKPDPSRIGLADDEIRLDAFSRHWWATWMRVRPFDPVAASRAAGLARQGVGWKIREGEAPTEAEAEAFAKIPRDGPEAAAWRKHLGAQGINDMPVPDRAEWIFMPSTLPQQGQAPVDGLAGTHGSDSAASAGDGDGTREPAGRPDRAQEEDDIDQAAEALT